MSDGRVIRVPAWFVRLLHERTILVLSVIFLLATGALMWHIHHLQANLVQSQGLQDAARYSQALAEFRTLYTSEVVTTVKDHGIEVTHDYKNRENAIPFPATLSMLLGNLMAEHGSGGRTRLYSAYPFPWRQDTGGLQDAFSRDAWDAFQDNSEEPFYRFEDYDGRPALRYATADLMRPSCVNCHNTHPDTPKNDWKVGDVRGVLEVITPLDGAIAQSRTNLRGTFVLMIGMTLLVLSGLAVVIHKLRHTASELEQRVRRRTAALSESEMRIHAIVDAAADGIITIDERGTIEEFNGAAQRIFGYGAEEVVGKNINILMPEPYRSEHDGHLHNYDRTGEKKIIGIRRELVGQRRDGSTFPLDLIVSEVRLSQGRVYTALVHDITKRKQAEEALRENQEYIENIIGSMIDMLIVVTPDGRIATVNRATLELLGYAQEDLIGQSFGVVMRDEDGHTSDVSVSKRGLPVERSLLRGLVQGGSISNVEAAYVTKDGREIPVVLSGSVMRSEDGETRGIVCVAQDLTRRRRLEVQLSHAQKLESIGQLAAGIAHEINTPTQFVGDNTRFLKDSFVGLTRLIQQFTQALDGTTTDHPWSERREELKAAVAEADLDYLMEEIPKAIDQSLEGIERVAKIVRSMKEFSHPSGEEKQPVDLNKAIETTVTVARNEWKYVSEVETDLDASLPLVPCHAGDINQVILNMIVNAAHAIGTVVDDGGAEKGKITIRTRLDGEHAEISISDTGAGMSEGVRSRIFDPFFTTKEVGKGTGQGLAISQDVIVRKHGGHIAVESEPGQGTTFTITLPLTPVNGEENTVGATSDEAAHSVC